MTTKKIQNFVQEYLSNLQKELGGLSFDQIEKVIKIIEAAYKKGKQIFVFGNGGSATTSSHMVCDLVKGCSFPGKKRFRAISLTDNTSIMTAIGNDLSYQDLFSQQLANFIQKEDIAIGISASGNSANVLRAIELAKGKGALTIGLVGFGGGKLAKLADYSVLTQLKHYGIAEDIHLILAHIICYYFKEKLKHL